LPKLDSERFAWFVSKIQESMGETGIPAKALFIAAGATAHKTELFDKDRLVFERLPAACPELNPVERFFKEVRKQLKNKIFDTLQQAQENIQLGVEKLCDEDEKVSSLTCFPYLKNTT
jgi:transposase